MNKLVTRMDFVERWADIVKCTKAKEWSSMQNKLINSQINNARKIKLTKEQVKYMRDA